MTLMLWKKKYELPTVAKRIKNWKEAALTHTIHSCSPVREEDVIFQGMHLWDKEEIIQGRIRRANIKKKKKRKKENERTSLVVQWLGLHVSNAGDTSLTLVRELSSHMSHNTAKQKRRKNKRKWIRILLVTFRKNNSPPCPPTKLWNMWI